MQIVIDIPEQIYKELTETAIIVTEVYPSTIERALTEGIVLPKGHGALKDADAFIKAECSQCDGYCDVCDCDCLNCKSDYRCEFIKDIDSAPTIIEADKEGAEE